MVLEKVKSSEKKIRMREKQVVEKLYELQDVLGKLELFCSK